LTVNRFNAGRAIDQYEVVLAFERGQRRLQPRFAVLDVDQLDLGAGELAIGRQHIVVAAGRAHAHRADFRFAEQQVIDRHFERALIHAAAHRRIALRIEVDQQDALFGRR
jgi:hypothetical protein